MLALVRRPSASAADPTVLTDAARPMVVYQLGCGSWILKLEESAGQIMLTFTP